MAELHDQIKRLEAYFDQNLIEVERKALEEEAAQDPGLEQRFRLQREALMAFELLGRDELRQGLRSMLSQVKGDRYRRRMQALRAGSVAVSVIMLIGLAVFFLPAFSTVQIQPQGEEAMQAVPVVNREEVAARIEEDGSDMEGLIDKYFHPYEISMKYGSSERINSLAQRLQVSYQNGHYEASIRGFKAILDANPKRSDALLGMGICYMAVDSLPQAAQAFAHIIYLGKDYTEESQWYLALAYFKEGMLIQAIGLMEEIARKKDHFKQAEARAILEEIR